MHVLLIHQAFACPQEPGGTRHYEFARSVVAHGHEFTVVASQLSYLTGQTTAATGRLIATESREGIRVLRVFPLPTLHRSFAWRVISFISFMVVSAWAALRTGHVDLVIGTSPPIFQAVSAWLVAAVRRRPFLLEIRDLWPEFAIDMGVLKNRVLIRLSRTLEDFLYSRATHISVNSPAYREYLRAKNIQADRISLIPNGVDPDMFGPNALGDRFRRELKLDGRFAVIYAGALGLANDIPTILRAASRLRDDSDIHFVLVGDGKERANLESMAKHLTLPNVTFTGSRPKLEMAEILAASDTCVATLKDIRMFRTTYPNKVFDYMVAGRPTVLAIDGVIRKVIEEAGGGIFVPPGNDLALANAVRVLFHNRQLAKAMGISAREYVVKHFNRDDQAALFRELLTRLAGTGS